MEEKNIIGYDFQGWPYKKMTIRDILKALGATFDEETNNWSFNDKNPILDVFPRTLEDDGMGYGVNEKFITEIDAYHDKLVNIFIEPKTI